MPYTTKKASKRTKHTFRLKPRKPFDTAGIRQPNPIHSIYAKGTQALVADEATEKRLNRSKNTAPSTSPRFGGMQFIW